MAQKSWYPGHMVATQKTIRDLAPYLTAFIEVVDARAPEITRHRPLVQWIGRTPLILVLNKDDLANPKITREWLQWYGQQNNVAAVSLNANSRSATSRLKYVLTSRLKPPYRLSVVGLPNLGKSTLLNRMVGKNRVRTGAKPGVTRGPQWIRLQGGWEWLDLPGVVTPSKSKDIRLKLLGVVQTEAEEMDALAEYAWQVMRPGSDPEEWLAMGKARGFLAAGGVIDRQRTAEAVVSGFRNGSLGQFSLERPGDADGF